MYQTFCVKNYGGGHVSQSQGGTRFLANDLVSNIFLMQYSFCKVKEQNVIIVTRGRVKHGMVIWKRCMEDTKGKESNQVSSGGTARYRKLQVSFSPPESKFQAAGGSSLCFSSVFSHHFHFSGKEILISTPSIL